LSNQQPLSDESLGSFMRRHFLSCRDVRLSIPLPPLSHSLHFNGLRLAFIGGTLVMPEEVAVHRGDGFLRLAIKVLTLVTEYQCE
jgi:hypothetical protein